MNLQCCLKFFACLGLLVAVTTANQASYSLPVVGLYNHEIPISSDNNAERNRAFTEALGAVIVRVTGQTQWLDNPVLAVALEQAQDYVEQIGYRSESVEVPQDQLEESLTEPADGPDADSPGSDNDAGIDALPRVNSAPTVQTLEQLYINVRFSRTAVDALLSSAGAPVWDSNRPSVLVWMVLQNDLGQRSLLGDELNQEVRTTIVDIAKERGLPVIFPVLDFEDRRNLSTDELWNLDENAIRSVSTRYAADSILAGRLYTTASGELVGRWQFIFQDNAETFDGFDIDLRQYIYQPLDRVTNQLAAYFAVLHNDSGQQNVRLRIEGVHDLSTYSTVLTYLQGLGVVDTVAIAQLEGQSLELELSLVGNQQQLLEMISLDRDMTPIRSVVTEYPNRLHYRWIR